MKIQSIRLIGAALALYISASCAAMFTGTTDTVSFHSKPDGAAVMFRGEEIGKTPFSIELTKKAKEVTYTHESYGERVVPIERSIRGGFIVMDILFTPGYGLLGLLIDGPTGAWYKLPAIVNCDFEAPVPAETEEEGATEEVTAAP